MIIEISNDSFCQQITEKFVTSKCLDTRIHRRYIIERYIHPSGKNNKG